MGRAQARRALEARVLPRAVARFYLRSLTTAVSRRDTAALAAIPDPRELRALLELAGGCSQVIEVGRDDPVTPVALAIGDARRKVTSFRPARRKAGAPYAALAGPSTRARVEVRQRTLERVRLSADQPACFAVIDGASDRRQVEAAFESCREAVRPGGLVVFRRNGDPAYGGVGEAIAALALGGRAEPEQLYVWRRPLEEPAPQAVTMRRRAPWTTLALALVGIGLGVGGGVLATQLSENANGGGGREPGPIPATGGATATQAPSDRGRPSGGRAADAAAGATVARPSGREGAAPPPQIVPASGALRFSGTRPRTLDRFRVRRDSLLRWAASRAPLEIKSDSFELSASALTGQTTIPRGTYRRVRIESPGRWTLEILPR